jgi:hypothetical protein
MGRMVKTCMKTAAAHDFLVQGRAVGVCLLVPPPPPPSSWQYQTMFYGVGDRKNGIECEKRRENIKKYLVKGYL